MKEVGIDIKGFTSDGIDEYDAKDFDIVISCCGCGKKLDPEDLIAWKRQAGFFDWALDGTTGRAGGHRSGGHVHDASVARRVGDGRWVGGVAYAVVLGVMLAVDVLLLLLLGPFMRAPPA